MVDDRSERICAGNCNLQLERLPDLGSLQGVFMVRTSTIKIIFFMWYVENYSKLIDSINKLLSLYPNGNLTKHCLDLSLLWKNIGILKSFELERYWERIHQSLHVNSEEECFLFCLFCIEMKKIPVNKLDLLGLYAFLIYLKLTIVNSVSRHHGGRRL